MTQSTTFQLFDLLIYTVWACLKVVTLYKTLTKKSSHKNHYNVNYSASITRCTALFRLIYTYRYFFVDAVLQTIYFRCVLMWWLRCWPIRSSCARPRHEECRWHLLFYCDILKLFDAFYFSLTTCTTIVNDFLFFNFEI